MASRVRDLASCMSSRSVSIDHAEAETLRAILSLGPFCLQHDVELAAMVSDFALLSICMGNTEPLGRERKAWRTERQIAPRFLARTYAGIDRGWRTLQLSSDQADLRPGCDKLVQLCYFSLCPGAARRPWSCHLPKSLNENGILIAINPPPQSGFPTWGVVKSANQRVVGLGGATDPEATIRQSC